jgi:hypothetical protein
MESTQSLHDACHCYLRRRLTPFVPDCAAWIRGRMPWLKLAAGWTENRAEGSRPLRTAHGTAVRANRRRHQELADQAIHPRTPSPSCSCPASPSLARLPSPCFLPSADLAAAAAEASQPSPKKQEPAGERHDSTPREGGDRRASHTRRAGRPDRWIQWTGPESGRKAAATDRPRGSREPPPNHSSTKTNTPPKGKRKQETERIARTSWHWPPTS